MARIPDDLLRRIRDEVPLERLAEGRGIELKRHGADLIGLCPFHGDKEPSLVITPAKNLWHCLGACQAGGSTIDWVMKAEGVSFRHAVEILRADFFPTSPLLDGPPKQTTVPQLASPLEMEASDRELLGQVIDYYHETLKQSPEAMTYLERRGLRSSEMIDRFKLGYANRTLGYRLPAMNRKAGQEIRTRLQKLGVLRESGHEHLNGSLVIPILGENTEVLGAYGRKIRSDLRPGTPDHLYLPGPHRGVFNVEALKASKEVILCEALIDVLTFWCAGFRNVTASYGVEGFTHDHLAAFKAYGTEQVLIAYDRDDAGDGAAEKLSKKLMAEGIACSRIQFPKGMDANDYALKVQPAAKSLGILIRSAVWMGNGGALRIGGGTATASPAPSPPPGGNSACEPVGKFGGDLDDDVVRLNERPAPLAAKEEKPARTVPDLDEVTLPLGDRRYRLRGLSKNLSWGVLKLNVLVTREGPEAETLFAPPSPLAGFFVDTLDLYSARQRASFEKQASHELGVTEETIRRDLGQLLRKAEELQQDAVQKALEPAVKVPSMSEEEREEALRLLRDPKLLTRILEGFETCGIVGEETNKLVGYLAAISRKLDRPLAVIVQSSSAAGKSALMEAVLAFVPEEDREKYSALTGQSLFYFGEGKSLRHKVLAIAEEEGAERATYALKLLQSEGELSIASTGKDPQTGRLVTQEYRVEGPVMIFLTTTAIEIDEELLNRCLVLTVDEERGQTRAIHDLQRRRETLEGLLLEEDKGELRRLHQNAQRLLRPLLVTNPFAERLTFLDDRTRTRRDHVKYLTLIRAIALLHQYQRPTRSVTHKGKVIEYIEVEPGDVAVANRLAAEVLGRSLDELPPQTRRLLGILGRVVAAGCEKAGVGQSDFLFSRKWAREATGFGDFQLRVHLERLVTLEYLLVHRGGRGQSFVYELLWSGEGADGKPFLMGLLDAGLLARTHESDGSSAVGTTGSARGAEGDFEGGSSPRRGAFEPLSSVGETGPEPAPRAALFDLVPPLPENALLGGDEKVLSYPRAATVAAASGGTVRRYVLHPGKAV